MTKKYQRRRVTSTSLGPNLQKNKNTLKTLTYLEKKEALKLMMEGDATPQMLAISYGCGVRQLQRLKQKGLSKSNGNIYKRNRDPLYIEVINLTIKDCDNHRALGQPLSGLMISGYAAHNAETIMKDTSGTYSEKIKAKYSKATFGESFVNGFKARYGFRGLRVNGERASVNEKETEEKMIVIREKIIKSLAGPADVWNWDETGLFYRSTPTGTLARKGDDGAGAKGDKLRVTLLLCVNGDGTKKEMVLIGKAAKPRGTSPEYWKSKGIKYFSNNKAWMDSKIFMELIKDFDSRLTRPTVLLLDNFSGHIKDLQDVELNHLEVIFLPANTTSKTQPLDAGIIASFKIHYRRSIMNFICTRLKEYTEFVEKRTAMQQKRVSNTIFIPVNIVYPFKINEITLVKAVPWLIQALEETKPLVVQKCFYKSLKMEMFKVADDDVNELDGMMEKLGLSMSTYLGREATGIEVQAFALEDERSLVDYEEDDALLDAENGEDVIVEDPSVIIDCLKRAQTYFRNTACPEEV